MASAILEQGCLGRSQSSEHWAPSACIASIPLLTWSSVTLYTAIHSLESEHSVFNLPSALLCVDFRVGLGPGSFGSVSKTAKC